MATTIDALAAAQELEAAGIKPEHAKAIVKTVSQANADLVTKADLKAELATLRSDLTTQLHATFTGLERRFIGYMVAAVLIVLAAIKYL